MKLVFYGQPDAYRRTSDNLGVGVIERRIHVSVQDTRVEQFLATSGDENLSAHLILPVVQELEFARSVELASRIGKTGTERLHV